ncbi:bifunctional 3,4-dihydroxy-2-butanone 4-phosphate synthase/GTP cyclohydrolase II protein [Mycobacteroides abscessus subsp. bolletii]|uniref:3,4-dihydroxy-2-butanone-4-phosphate synthase n=1 Tax=Mycobacteroides abscessus TaxID=36809 RepID=UPI0009A8F3DC|nr:3,4-dihydroxy-2-butanone-4-phosphate synthase [Mycobacteroides abscessus]SKG71969.1 bifunctional 3,4-dihydroxy-2-butanone 4-phosphate synthase/GTP cyclohydrolase II protein [Mycobacteroides abscessus subsp. bolletii]SKH10653.1 bifunctional 3,4-dihydroxy-2-butanone 4-phosphate synthase/GTP cyclohydrolase II protein [Mycobacteroides abscessus subsp. bolletii]
MTQSLIYGSSQTASAFPPWGADLQRGRPVVMSHRCAQGDLCLLVVPCGSVSVATMAFLVRHCSGLVCVTVPAEHCARLGMSAMTAADDDAPMGAFRVAVDAASGVGTGVSARDRTHTARMLADSRSVSTDFVRPGHVLPVRVDKRIKARGLPGRAAQNAAAIVDSAGFGGFAVFSHLLSEDQREAQNHDGADIFARAHKLYSLTIDT